MRCCSASNLLRTRSCAFVRRARSKAKRSSEWTTNTRTPGSFIEMNPDDMSELKVAPGDLVEVYNDDGSTQAMVYPTPTAKKGHTFMLFGYPTGVQGNVVNAGTNELILPNYKQTWADIRKLAAAPASVKHLSFKAQEYKAG
jgi:arsenite oxidase large subunit